MNSVQGYYHNIVLCKVIIMFC